MIALFAVGVALAGDPLDPRLLDRSTTRVGLGAAVDTLEGAALGLDLSGTAPLSRRSRVSIDFEHRYRPAPSGAVEQALVELGASEGVRSWWAGNMRFATGWRGLLGVPDDGAPLPVWAPGFELRLSLLFQRTITERGQQALLDRYGIFLGPRYALLAGPELQLGLYSLSDWAWVGLVGRYHHPVHARFDEDNLGIESQGRLYDPAELVDRRAQGGLGFRYRYGQIYVECDALGLWVLPGVAASDWGAVARRGLSGDVALGIGF